jgi:hypothetical protein
MLQYREQNSRYSAPVAVNHNNSQIILLSRALLLSCRVAIVGKNIIDNSFKEVPFIWDLSCIQFVILLAMDSVTEKLPTFGNIFERAVRYSKAILVRRSSDTYSAVSFNYQHVSGRDQTSIFAQLDWKVMAYWGCFAESAPVRGFWFHCCTGDFTLQTNRVFCF